MSGVASLLRAASAVAALHGHRPEVIDLSIPPQRLDHAVLALGAAARVSIGGDIASCGQAIRGLSGRMEAVAALHALLAGAPCEAVALDRRAFLLRRRSVSTRRAYSSPPPTASRARTEPSQVQEVVVSAGRRDGVLRRYPGYAVVASGAALERTDLEDLASLAGFIPGLAVTNLGPGRDKFFIRGASDGAFTGASPSTVAIYLDDLPVAYNAPDPDLRLVDVDRVEVVGGPQGALYGAGSIGGVLRLVTRPPQFDRREGEISASISSTEHGGLGSATQGWINAPLFGDRLAIRASGYVERAPGWLDLPKLGVRGSNVLDRGGGRVALLWRATDDWSVQIAAASQSLNTADDQYVLRSSAPRVRDVHLLEPHDNDFLSLSAKLEGETGVGRLKVAVARIEHRSTTRSDATSALGRFGDATTSDVAAYDDSHHRKLTFAEATLTSSGAGRWSWLAGAFVARSKDGVDDRVTTVDAAVLYHEARRDQLEEEAGFGEVARRLDTRWTVRLGGRVSTSRLDVGSTVTQPALSSASRSFGGAATTLRFSPRLALEYTASDRLFGYVDVSDGYRPAQINTAGALRQRFGGRGEPLRVVQGDRARTWEIGARWSPTHMASVSTSLFYTDWRGVQSDQYLATGLPFSITIGNASIDGAEASVEWRPAAGLRVVGSAFLADPQLTALRNVGFPSRRDAGLPGVTSRAASTALEWRGRVADRLETSARIGAAYVGPSAIAFDAASQSRSQGFVQTNAEISVSRAAWRLTLRGDNLLAAQANTFAFGNAFSFPITRQATLQRPRTVGLELARGF